MSKTKCCKLRMPDADLLEAFYAPKIAVHANGAEIETRNAQRLTANLRIPAIETAKIQIRFAIREPSGFDRMGIVNEKQEHVAVAGVKRGGVLGDVDEWIVSHRSPIQNARHLPHGVTGTIARDLHHGGDKLVIPDTAIVRAGYGAKFNAPVCRLEGLHQFRPMAQKAVL